MADIRSIPGMMLSICLMGLVGCSLPYDVPAFDAGLDPVPASAPEASFLGIGSLLNPSRPVHVLWTHGMCSHNLNWAARAGRLLENALVEIYGQVGEQQGLNADPEQEELANGTYTLTKNINTKRGKVHANFLIWSRLTDPFKTRLAFDAPKGEVVLIGEPPNDEYEGQFPYKRASFNNKLKVDLLNDCLVDAVIYSGQNGDKIREDFIEAVCKFLGGSFTKSKDCSFSKPAEDVTRILVAESLGSKMLFDAVLTIERKSSASARKDLLDRLSRIEVIFLAANQVPLLDQANPVDLANKSALAVADPVGGQPSSMNRFFEVLGRSQSTKESSEERGARAFIESRRAVVAFTDPNDLLSYRLTRDFVGDSGWRLVNVIVSNDWTYFGAVERPDTGHCGYRWNAYVLQMMALGNPGWESVSLEPKRQIIC